MLRVYCILQYALKFFKKIMLKIGEYARIREINKLEFEVEICMKYEKYIAMKYWTPLL